MAKKSAFKGKDVLNQVRKGQDLSPVYYICGDDPYLISEIIESLKGRILPQFKDFNLHHVTAGEVEGDKIASLAMQLPVMDACTMVFVREAQLLKKADWEGLARYLEDPSPTTCLVLLDPNDSPQIDKRTKAGKLIAKYTVGCRKPYDNQMPRWVEDRARIHKLRLGPDVAYRLLELLGNDLASLNNALERIALYLGGKGDVSIDLVNEQVAENRTYNLFELSGLIGDRNLQGALHLLRGLMETGEHPLKLLVLMAKAFRSLLKARVAYDQGARLHDMDAFVNPRIRYKRDEKVRELFQQVKRFTTPELIKAISLMQEADFSFKSTSGLTPELLMERLVIELCQLRVS
ncbi:MAG TPA: DNA polymerase III subunit delta [Myxococcales bacterium]|nr:DNA polymerase III subunit delta [Deltaproteobacteria bacterium]MBU49627.1 DNA polymerase III subunit delta [Deltaproteobacteria bacterium]HAA56478.1 DNA polymerase III subunit delta [Myxococcales bacterium]|tara:strand:- start:990 stop:2033 length:1044 start_codon:yes stop_codon:yes gene_type:complete